MHRKESEVLLEDRTVIFPLQLDHRRSYYYPIMSGENVLDVHDGPSVFAPHSPADQMDTLVSKWQECSERDSEVPGERKEMEVDEPCLGEGAETGLSWQEPILKEVEDSLPSTNMEGEGVVEGNERSTPHILHCCGGPPADGQKLQDWRMDPGSAC